MMELDEIGVFVDVVRAGSISAAARRARVPKSTISRAVLRLEERLGTALLTRVPRGELLTAAGADLAQQVTPHIDALTAVRLTPRTDEPIGRLRITAPNDFGRAFLGAALVEFCRRHPRLQVEIDLSMRVVDLVGEGFDVALRVSNTKPIRSALVAYPMASLSLHLYAAPSFLEAHGPIRSTRGLVAHQNAGRIVAAGPRQFTITNGERREKLRVTLPLVGNDIYFIRDVIVAGAAVGPLPTHVARHDVEAGRLVPVLPTFGIHDLAVYFVHPPHSPVPPRIRSFREFLTPIVAELFAARGLA